LHFVSDYFDFLHHQSLLIIEYEVELPK